MSCSAMAAAVRTGCLAGTPEASVPLSGSPSLSRAARPNASLIVALTLSRTSRRTTLPAPVAIHRLASSSSAGTWRHPSSSLRQSSIASPLQFNPLPQRLGPKRAITRPSVSVKASAAGAAAAVPEPEAKAPAPGWPGVLPLPFVLSVGVGLALRFLVPVPEGLTTQSWQLLAIFLSTITGLVLGPLPVGAWAFVCLTTTIVSKTLPFSLAFSAMTNEVIWLIVISFFFARGFVKTGLGDRVATYFVKWFGKSTLGLAYGLAASEALIAPAMPSTTARAGGVFLPIINSLSQSFGSLPNDPTAKKLGAFLLMSQFQTGVHASAMVLTGAAQNLLCVKLASELGVIIPDTFTTWFKLAVPAGIVGTILTPLLLFKLFPPELQDTPEAPGLADKKLEAMGPVTGKEWIMVATMLLAVTLWVTGESIGVPSVVAAMIALCVLLLTGVLTWDDCLSEKSAWDTLAWFAVLIGMSAQLNNMGIVKWMADVVGKSLAGSGSNWVPTFAKLQSMYFLSHYLFASQTGHVGALYSAFLAMQLAAGVPGIVATLALCINTNLFGSITHYSSGQAALYYGAGYLELPEVFKFGAISAVVNILIWVGVCGVWWKANGIY